MYYAFIKNERIDGKGECRQLTQGVINYEISEAVYNDLERYMWNGESVVENPNYQPDHKEEIEQLKAYLAATDYVVIKIAEGVATAEQYADVIAQRQQWRARINELEQ